MNGDIPFPRTETILDDEPEEDDTVPGLDPATDDDSDEETAAPVASCHSNRNPKVAEEKGKKREIRSEVFEEEIYESMEEVFTYKEDSTDGEWSDSDKLAVNASSSSRASSSQLPSTKSKKKTTKSDQLYRPNSSRAKSYSPSSSNKRKELAHKQ